MESTKRIKTSYTTEEYYYNKYNTPELQFPRDAFTLVKNYNGKLTLQIKEKYAIEIIARMLSEYDYASYRIVNEDENPFNLLSIAEGQIYVEATGKESIVRNGIVTGEELTAGHDF